MGANQKHGFSNSIFKNETYTLQYIHYTYTKESTPTILVCFFNEYALQLMKSKNSVSKNIRKYEKLNIENSCHAVTSYLSLNACIEMPETFNMTT